MSANPAELSGAVIIERIESGLYPPEVVETIARGFLPLPQDELIAVLAFLTRSPLPEVAAAARSSLADVPSRSVHAFASNENAPPEQQTMVDCGMGFVPPEGARFLYLFTLPRR